MIFTPRFVFSAVIASCIMHTVIACGDTRRSLGDECLRGEDCLSGLCTARVCTTPGEQTSLSGDFSGAIPSVSPSADASAAASDASADAASRRPSSGRSYHFEETGQ